MKVKVPPIQSQTVEGEKETPVLQRLADDAGVQVETKKENPLVTALFTQGFWVRAVVTWRFLVVDRKIDPNNWGIVISADPYRPFPLEIRFMDGKTIMSDGKDLELIYRAQTSGNMKAWLSEPTKGSHEIH